MGRGRVFPFHARLLGERSQSLRTLRNLAGTLARCPARRPALAECWPTASRNCTSPTVASTYTRAGLPMRSGPGRRAVPSYGLCPRWLNLCCLQSALRTPGSTSAPWDQLGSEQRPRGLKGCGKVPDFLAFASESAGQPWLGFPSIWYAAYDTERYMALDSTESGSSSGVPTALRAGGGGS